MIGLFDGGPFRYSCRKAFSTIKQFCTASECILCKQLCCLNRTGLIISSPITATTATTSSSESSFLSKSLQKMSNETTLRITLILMWALVYAIFLKCVRPVTIQLPGDLCQAVIAQRNDTLSAPCIIPIRIARQSPTNMQSFSDWYENQPITKKRP